MTKRSHVGGQAEGDTVEVGNAGGSDGHRVGVGFRPDGNEVPAQIAAEGLRRRWRPPTHGMRFRRAIGPSRRPRGRGRCGGCPKRCRSLVHWSSAAMRRARRRSGGGSGVRTSGRWRWRGVGTLGPCSRRRGSWTSSGRWRRRELFEGCREVAHDQSNASRPTTTQAALAAAAVDAASTGALGISNLRHHVKGFADDPRRAIQLH